MVPRALLRLFPALLVVLVFLCGTPSMGMGGPQASAASWSIGVAPAPAVRGGLTSEIPDGAINPAADEDDSPDDPIVRVVARIVWPGSGSKPRMRGANERARPTHRPCAAEPRAPPIA